MPVIHSRSLFKALQDAGIFTEEDGNRITRFVIDARVNDAVRLYVERVGETRLAELLPDLLQGIIETKVEVQA